jgi:excisionase family DNA binding protein
MKTWLTVAEGAEYAGLSRDTIYTACERRELGHARVGGRRAIRLKAEWIDAWLERHAPAAQDRRMIAHTSRQASKDDDARMPHDAGSTTPGSGRPQTGRLQRGPGDGC